MFRKLFFISMVLSIVGCAEYRWEFYSADESTMNSFREDIIKDKIMVGLAIKGAESRTHIPLIWRKVVAKSPYSIELGVITKLASYDYILLHSAHLVMENGEAINIMDSSNSIKIDFDNEDYSKFARGKVRQAYYEFPKKITIDFSKNRKISVNANITIASKGLSRKKKIEAPFYAILKEGSTFILSTYTN